MAFHPFTKQEIQFIQDHLSYDPLELILKAKNYPHISIKKIAVQIESRQRAKKKLPEWYSNPEVVFPPKENLEQASSEITARFKSRSIKGKSIADLTGGSGIDLFYMSEEFEEVFYIEPNSTLAEFSVHNFELFGKELQVQNTSAEVFLANSDQIFDVIYIDPSRRDATKNRVYGLEEYQPNVIELYSLLLKKGREVIIKVSPMVDIKHTLVQLPNTHKVQVVAVDNEVKELLFWVKPGHEEEPIIEAWNLSGTRMEQFFSFTYSEESGALSKFNSPKKFLYEPNTAIRKAGAFNLIGNSFAFDKIHSNTHLYTSESIKNEFSGRVFEVKEMIKPNKKEIKKRFSNGKVNVISKNFPMGANELKKKFKLHDGGEEFLIFCEAIELGKIALHCILIKN